MTRPHRQRLQTTTKPPDKQTAVAYLANAFLASTDYNFVMQLRIFTCPITFILLFYHPELIIRRVRKEKRTTAKTRPAILFQRSFPVTCRSAIGQFFPSLVIVQEVFAKVNSAQFPLVSI